MQLLLLDKNLFNSDFLNEILPNITKGNFLEEIRPNLTEGKIAKCVRKYCFFLLENKNLTSAYLIKI